MKILVACEFSGRVRNAFAHRGHSVVSCDLLPSLDNSPSHHIGDVLRLLDHSWDLVIAFPPCTYLCSSGLHWNTKRPERALLTTEAVEFARAFVDSAPLVCIENPIGCLSTHIGKPTQIIQPYQFGEDASKATCLWLKGLPPLQPTHYVEPRIIDGRPRWSNQTNSGQNRLGPSAERSNLRSLTYPGIAQAMASQWG